MKLILIIFMLFGLSNASISISKEKELCSIIIDKKIENLGDKCVKYLDKFKSYDKINSEFNKLDDGAKKRQLFKHYAIEYRKVVTLTERIHDTIGAYIIHNHTSDDTDTLKNVDMIFSNNNYIASDYVIRALIQSQGGNVDISPQGLDKIKVYMDRKKAREEAKKAREKAEQERKKYNTQQTRTSTRAPSRYTSKPNNNSELRLIDLVSASALYTKVSNTLKVKFFYKNKSQDKSIYWKTGRVTASCSAYEDRGNALNHKKGAKIGQNINHTLTNAFQDLYITTSATRTTYGIVECRVQINGRTFKTYNTPLLNY